LSVQREAMETRSPATEVALLRFGGVYRRFCGDATVGGAGAIRRVGVLIPAGEEWKG